VAWGCQKVRCCDSGDQLFDTVLTVYPEYLLTKFSTLQLTDSLIRCGPLRESREVNLEPGRNTYFVQVWFFPGRPQSDVGHDEERCEADRCSTHTLVPVLLRTWGKVRLDSVSQALGDPWQVIMRLRESGICSIVHTCVFYPESIQNCSASKKPESSLGFPHPMVI